MFAVNLKMIKHWLNVKDRQETEVYTPLQLMATMQNKKTQL